MKSQKVFRYIWRINGVLILLAVAAILISVVFMVAQEFRRSAALTRSVNAAGIPVAEANQQSDLHLGHASLVEGTNVLRADLQTRGDNEAKFSSGYSFEKRNILFMERGEKTARWLLADNNHVITETLDITDRKGTANEFVATAVFVKSADDSTELSNGRLLLFDPPGRKVIEVSNNAKELHVAAISGAELTILYERDRRFVLAAYDPSSLAKLREQEIDVPVLK